MANILADVIIPIAGIVDRFLKPNGIFISSGIIYMKEDDVKEAVKKNENLQLTDVVKPVSYTHLGNRLAQEQFLNTQI